MYLTLREWLHPHVKAVQPANGVQYILSMISLRKSPPSREGDRSRPQTSSISSSSTARYMFQYKTASRQELTGTTTTAPTD